MTVTYTREVATSKGFSCFLKLLARWRGSIYKLVYIELIVFLALFYALHAIYIFILNEEWRALFEKFSVYCLHSTSLIPLSFVLGFYVTIVMTRWWNQYCSIPFPDSIAVYVSATIHGQDERGRIMRRTIMRYVCLAVTMLFTNISSKVKKRFPTLEHLIAAGLLEENEKNVLDGVNKRSPKYSKHWMPLVWAASIVTRARKEGRVRDDFAVKTMLDEINKFRGHCGKLITYDYISIPLVYTQVVTLAVYTYFFATLMGQQNFKQLREHQYYTFPLPVFTLLQFFFYMGWLKVAESLINPFGDDDDDFDLNWMVDRNMQISYLIVDEMHHEHPELIKDQYWDEVFPEQLPYTPETEAYSQLFPVPSTANIHKLYEDDRSVIGSKYKLNLEDLESRPIMFSAKRGSHHSLASSGKPTRVRKNSITNQIRRFLPRSDSHSSVSDIELLEKIPRNVIEDVIEEVDEQLTIMAKREEPSRMNIMDIFKNENEKVQNKLETSEDEVTLLSDDKYVVDSNLAEEQQEKRLIKLKTNLTHYLKSQDK